MDETEDMRRMINSEKLVKFNESEGLAELGIGILEC